MKLLRQSHYNRGRREVYNAHRYYSQMMDDSFDSMDDGDDDDTKYSDKEQLVALLLSIFLGGAGGGRFYVGDYGLASGKLILCVLLICAPCVICCFAGPGIVMDRRRGPNQSPDYGLVAGCGGCVAICFILCAYFALAGINQYILCFVSFLTYIALLSQHGKLRILCCLLKMK